MGDFKSLTSGNNTYYVKDETARNAITQLDGRVTTLESAMLSHVGMIIHSTTLATETQVKAIYGGTKWIQHSGYFLRGATSGVTGGKTHNVADGGSDDAVVVSHSHAATRGQFVEAGTQTQTILGSYSTVYGGVALDSNTANTGVSGTNKNIPKYKNVYIWERVS